MNGQLKKNPPEPSSRVGPRKLVILTLLFLAVLAVLIGYPYYETYEAPWRETVLKVNDTVFDMRDYMRAHRLLAGQPESSSFEVSMRVLESMQHGELIRLEAKKRNIELTDDEVTREIKRRVLGSQPNQGEFQKQYEGFLRNIRLTDRQYREWVRMGLLRKVLREHLGKEIPTRAEQVHVHAILVATPEKAEEVRTRLWKGEDFEKWARKETTDYRYKSKGGDMGWIPKGVDDTQVIQQVRARGIFTKTIGAADEARARLLAGEDFAGISKALTGDKESREKGGELGWLAKELRPLPFSDETIFDLSSGTITKPIESDGGFWVVQILEKAPNGKLIDDIAFSLPIGQLSPPLFSESGYYLLKVSEKASVRSIDEKHMENLRAKALDRWLKDTTSKGSEEGWIEWHWDSFKYAWSVEQLKQ
ncbi:MAG: peptidylprolyl isomerase [Desulfatiglandales bacterium]